MTGSLTTGGPTERSGPPASSAESPAIPAEIKGLFAQPPLINGEDPEAYERLLARLAAEIDPRATAEWFWVKDLADNIWETLRLRRIAASLMTIGMRRMARKLLCPLMSNEGAADQELAENAEELVLDHLAGKGDATKKLQELLTRGGLDLDALSAMSLKDNLDAFERLDRMLASQEKRRMQTLREVEMHQAILAERMRQASNQVIDEVAGIPAAA